MKTIMMALLITSLLSCTTEKVNGQVFNRETNYKIKFNPTMLGLVAGGGFIVAGLLTKPERKWVPDNTSNSSTFYGQQGHWRNRGRTRVRLEGQAQDQNFEWMTFPYL